MAEIRRANDLGGQPAGAIDTSHHPEADWEKMVTALNGALGPAGAGLLRVDERRRTTEDLAEYGRHAYFAKSARATAELMVEKGVLTPDEILARMADIKARRGGA